MDTFNVLVTGGAGFIGSYLAYTLSKAGHNVRILDLVSPEPALSKITEYIKGNILESSSLRAFKDIDVVYHCAAKLPVEKCSFKEYSLVNYYGTLRALEYSMSMGVSKFVYLSSSAVYGYPNSPIRESSPRSPIEPYGKSKLLAEEACYAYRNLGLNTIIVRPRTVLGPRRLGILSVLFYWISNNKNVYLIGDGNNLYQLLDIEDLVNALVLLLNSDCSNTEYNIGALKYGTLNDDLSSLIRAVGSSSRIVHVPSFIGKSACRLLDRLTPLAKWHYLFIDKPFYFDISKALKELHWTPKYSNKEMLLKWYSWYVESFSIGESTHRREAPPRILRFLP